MTITVDMEAVSAREQRMYKRIDFREPVQFWFKNPACCGGCLSCDLSEGGVRLAMNDFVPLGAELILQIHLAAEKVIDDVARVVWVRKIPSAERYEVGLEFSGDRIRSLGSYGG